MPTRTIIRPMIFEQSNKVRDLAQRLTAFMDEHIYPNEATFRQQIAEGDRWQPTAIVEELKAEGARRRACGISFFPRASTAPD